MKRKDIPFDKIFKMVATSDRSILFICKQLKIPYALVFSAIQRDPELFQRNQTAREAQADFIVESIMDKQNKLADEMKSMVDPREKFAAINYMRLVSDNIKWIACKFRRNIYGDSVAVHHNLEAMQEKFKNLFTKGKVDDKIKVNTTPVIPTHVISSDEPKLIEATSQQHTSQVSPPTTISKHVFKQSINKDPRTSLDEDEI